MSSPGERFEPSVGFWLCVPVATVVTWGLHELAHFQAGRWLGYEMWMSMNRAGPLEGGYASTTHRVIVAMAGPFVTYIQALVAFALVRRWHLGGAYPFLFFALFMRLTAFVIGISHPNDEARTSLDLGLPVWALPAVVVALLLLLTIAGSRTLRVGWRTNTVLYLLASLITAAIVFGDPIVGRLAQD